MFISQSFTVELFPGRNLFRALINVGILCCFAAAAPAQVQRISAEANASKIDTAAPLANLQIACLLYTSDAADE